MLIYAIDFLRELEQTYINGTSKISVNGFPIDKIEVAKNDSIVIFSKELEKTLNNFKTI